MELYKTKSLIVKAVQPWGKAPTQLVPMAVIRNFGYIHAPNQLKRIVGDYLTLADLDETIWEHVNTVDNHCLTEIINILRSISNDLKEFRIFSDRLSQPLDNLPFSTRTKNAIKAYPDKFLKPQLKFGDLMSIPSFGIRSAIEFACVVESA